MRNPETEIDVRAPVEHVWQILTDFGSYPRWNPCVEFDGTPREGQTVRMKVTLFGRGIEVPVRIEAIIDRRELRWCGGPAWLMQGTHYFRLEAIDSEMTRVVHGERFTGAAVGILWPFLARELGRFYVRINEALRTRCESAPAKVQGESPREVTVHDGKRAACGRASGQARATK